MPLSCSEALQRLQSLPSRFTSFTRSLDKIYEFANIVIRVLGILLPIFLLHQLFLWVSQDPSKAFDLARFLVEVFELVWDLFVLLWNVQAEVVNAAILPLWNAVSFYVIEPAVVLVLEIFSLVFLRKRYDGFIKEADFPYGGFVCDSSSAVSATWCGRFGAYNERLAESGSESAEQSTTFGVATARRLSELAGDDDVAVPSVDTEELIGALDGLSTQGIVMGASAFDVLFAVLYEIFSTTAVFLFDAIWIILKTVFDIIKMLVKSGLLQTILGIGIDFLIIVALEIGVPLLIAGIDFVVCVFQLFLIDTWAAQLECIESERMRARAAPMPLADWSVPPARAQTSASKAPTPPRTSGSSTRSRRWWSGLRRFCRQRSTREQDKRSPAARRSTWA